MDKQEVKPKFKIGDTVKIIISDDFPALIDNDPGNVGWVSYEEEHEYSMHALYNHVGKITNIQKEKSIYDNEPVYIYKVDDSRFWWNENWLDKAKENSKITLFINSFNEGDKNAS